jgi:hypothetical protein
MNTNREKTSSVMGFVMSALLHGIFLAGCVAINFSFDQPGTTSNNPKTEITHHTNHTDIVKGKS